MNSISITRARAQLDHLVDDTASSHQPIHITGKRSNAVLVSEEDWRSIQETLYLLCGRGMRDSIGKGMKEPMGKSAKSLAW